MRNRCLGVLRRQVGFSGLIVCVVLGVLASLPAKAQELTPLRVRVSVKRVLSNSNTPPQGFYGVSANIRNVFGEANDTLRRSRAPYALELVELVDTRAASQFYDMTASQTSSFESAAIANPSGYRWRSDAVNIYVVNQIEDAGGICSFPTAGSHRNIIVIHSGGLLGASQGWLHELGHYFNLIHTHESDDVADTIDDSRPPNPFDCSVHDGNFVSSASGSSELDITNVLRNVMSYHCSPNILTPLQLIRWQRAAEDHRAAVVEFGTPVPPVATIAPLVGLEGGQLPMSNGTATVTLDGRFSHDGKGFTEIHFGNDPDDKTPTYYFRTVLDIEDAGELSGVTLRLLRDDGAIVYINGDQVLRSNMGGGTVGFNTLASDSISGDAERTFQTTNISSSAFDDGMNHIAVEVHQSSRSSSDLSFALEIESGGNVLLPAAHAWRYSDEGVDLGSAWRDPDYDDSDWLVGVAPFGYSNVYGDGRVVLREWELVEGPSAGVEFLSGREEGWELVRTSVGYGDLDDFTQLTDMRGNYLTIYLTRSFFLSRTDQFAGYVLDVTYDDGFAAYLNGTEVARLNLIRSAGPNTRANSSIEARRVAVDLDPFLDAIELGRNNLSIEVHNQDLNSGDLTAHPLLYGKLSDGTLVPIVGSQSDWYLWKGSEGAPPEGWTAASYDAGNSEADVEFTAAGHYRFRLSTTSVDGSLTAVDEIELTVGEGFFLRGDCNQDGTVEISDGLRNLLSLFGAGPAPECPDACDANDDELQDVTDTVYLLSYLVQLGPEPPPPFAFLGLDPEGDELDCGER